MQYSSLWAPEVNHLADLISCFPGASEFDDNKTQLKKISENERSVTDRNRVAAPSYAIEGQVATATTTRWLDDCRPEHLPARGVVSSVEKLPMGTRKSAATIRCRTSIIQTGGNAKFRYVQRKFYENSIGFNVGRSIWRSYEDSEET